LRKSKLHELRHLTATPVSPMNNTIIGDDLINSHHLPNRTLLTDLKDVIETIRFLNLLVDAPESIHLLAVGRQVRFLLDSFVEDQTLREDIHTIRYWYFELLAKMLGKTNYYPVPTGTKTSHSIYWLHFLLGGRTTPDEPKKELPLFYREFGLYFHTQLRKIEFQYPSRRIQNRSGLKSPIYTYYLASTVLAEHAKELTVEQIKELITDKQLQRRVFRAASYKAMERACGSGLDEDGVYGHEDYVEAKMTALETLISGKVNPRQSEFGRYPGAGIQKPRELTSLPIPPTGTKIGVLRSPKPPEDIQPSEDDKIIVTPIIQSHPVPDFVQKKIQAATKYHRIKASWERGAPDSLDLAVLYGVIFSDEWSKFSLGNKAWRLFALLLVHTGMKPSILAQAALGSMPDVEQHLKKKTHLFYDPELVCFEYEPHKNFFIAAEESPDEGPPRKRVVVPLPDSLGRLLSEYGQEVMDRGGSGESLWWREDDRGEMHLADQVWLSAHISQAVISSRLGQNPQVSKVLQVNSLPHAFERLHVTRQGLPPEMGSMIAGHPLLGRDTPIFYTRVDRGHLYRLYSKAFNRVHQEIVEDMQALIGSTNHVCLASEDPSSLFRKIPKGSNGTAFCPTMQEASAFLSQLEAKYKEYWQRDNNLAHDLYAIYAWELLRLFTGMRLESRPQYVYPHFFGQVAQGRANRKQDEKDRMGWLRIADKASRNYDEWRLVPVSADMLDLLYQLETNKPLLETSLPDAPSVSLRKTGDNIFRLSMGRNWARFVTQADVQQTLQRVGMEYPFKNNWSRHFVKSYLLDKLPTQVVDAFLGHHVRGPDPMDIISSHQLQEYARLFTFQMASLTRSLLGGRKEDR
jgi:hypothetical protein